MTDLSVGTILTVGTTRLPTHPDVTFHWHFKLLNGDDAEPYQLQARIDQYRTERRFPSELTETKLVAEATNLAHSLVNADSNAEASDIS